VRQFRGQVLGASVLPTETKVKGKYTTSDPYVRLALGAKVRKTPSWPRSWANFSLFSCVPAGIRGPTCIFWANLTAFSRKPTKDRGWKHQTRPVMKTLMPRWAGAEATFELGVGTANAASAAAHELHFQVMEKDKGLNPDDFLGCGRFKNTTV
jgi:hypothetical protein